MSKVSASTQKNWWGAEPHPSDCLTHWSDKPQSKRFRERNAKLRQAWDMLHTTPALTAAFDVVMEHAEDHARNNAADERMGEYL